MSRVMPGSTLLSSVGVATVLPCTKKMFSPVPSHTWPSIFSMIASSNPAAIASVFARMEFR